MIAWLVVNAAAYAGMAFAVAQSRWAFVVMGVWTLMSFAGLVTISGAVAAEQELNREALRQAGLDVPRQTTTRGSVR